MEPFRSITKRLILKQFGSVIAFGLQILGLNDIKNKKFQHTTELKLVNYCELSSRLFNQKSDLQELKVTKNILSRKRKLIC